MAHRPGSYAPRSPDLKGYQRFEDDGRGTAPRAGTYLANTANQRGWSSQNPSNAAIQNSGADMVSFPYTTTDAYPSPKTFQPHLYPMPSAHRNQASQLHQYHPNASYQQPTQNTYAQPPYPSYPSYATSAGPPVNTAHPPLTTSSATPMDIESQSSTLPNSRTSVKMESSALGSQSQRKPKAPATTKDSQGRSTKGRKADDINSEKNDPDEILAPGIREGVEVRTKFPVARIKRLMQADEDVGKVSQVTPTAVSKALELFIVSMILKSCNVARARQSTRVTAAHMKSVVQTEEQLDFLEQIMARIPDAQKPAPAPAADGNKSVDSRNSFVTSGSRTKSAVMNMDLESKPPSNPHSAASTASKRKSNEQSHYRTVGNATEHDSQDEDECEEEQDSGDEEDEDRDEAVIDNSDDSDGTYGATTRARKKQKSGSRKGTIASGLPSDASTQRKARR